MAFRGLPYHRFFPFRRWGHGAIFSISRISTRKNRMKCAQLQLPLSAEKGKSTRHQLPGKWNESSCQGGVQVAIFVAQKTTKGDDGQPGSVDTQFDAILDPMQRLVTIYKELRSLAEVAEDGTVGLRPANPIQRLIGFVQQLEQVQFHNQALSSRMDCPTWSRSSTRSASGHMDGNVSMPAEMPKLNWQ